MSAIYRTEAGESLLRERYLAALDHWPIEHERLQVTTPEGETCVLASGAETAPPLVLLHGSGSNSAQWRDRVGSLAQHFRVYAIDIIGEPGLSAPSRPPLDSDSYAVWLDAVLDSLGSDRVAIIGMSLGGWLALDYAVRRTPRVERLALTCPPGIGRSRKGYQLMAILLSPFGRRRVVNHILGPGFAALPAEVAEGILEQQAIVSRHYHYRPADLPIFDDDALRRLTTPIHVRMGEQDVMFDSAETRRRLESVVPHATVRLLPGIGHLVPPDESEELDFLTSSSRT